MSVLLFILLQLPVFTGLQADFRQQKVSELLSAPQFSEGHFVYRAPDYLLWEYTSPSKLVWEVDGTKTNANRNVTRLVNIILQTINGKNLQTNQQFEVERQSGNVYILRPRQRELQRYLSSVSVTLNAATQVADKVVISEPNGDTTTITFSKVIVGK